MASSSHKLVALVIISLLLFSNSSFVKENAIFQQGLGTWSDHIQGQSDSGSSPLQYFLCGQAVRQMKWMVELHNCNCRRGLYRLFYQYRCDYCPNYFWSKTNAVKLIFCHYLDWNNQIEKIVESGNKQSGNWKEFKCQNKQFVSRAAAKFGGVQHGVSLGLVGGQFKCENINLSESSLVQDNSGYGLRQMSKNTQGYFVSTVQVKFKQNDSITGIKYGFEPMTTVSNIVVKYGKPQTRNQRLKTIDKSQVSNNAPTISQITVGLNKNYTIRNKYTNYPFYTNNYMLDDGVGIDPLPWTEGKSEESTYQQKRENFVFNRWIATTQTSTQQLLVVSPPKKRMIVSSNISQQDVTVPYEATMTLVEKLTKKFVMDLKVNGFQEGVMASSIKIGIDEESLTGSDDKANLRVDPSLQSNRSGLFDILSCVFKNFHEVTKLLNGQKEK